MVDLSIVMSVVVDHFRGSSMVGASAGSAIHGGLYWSLLILFGCVSHLLYNTCKTHIYITINIYIYRYIHTYIYIQTYIHTYTYIYIHTYVWSYIHIYTYIYTYITGDIPYIAGIFHQFLIRGPSDRGPQGWLWSGDLWGYELASARYLDGRTGEAQKGEDGPKMD